MNMVGAVKSGGYGKDQSRPFGLMDISEFDKKTEESPRCQEGHCG